MASRTELNEQDYEGKFALKVHSFQLPATCYLMPATLLPCYLATLLPCYLIAATLLPCYLIPATSCCQVEFNDKELLEVRTTRQPHSLLEELEHAGFFLLQNLIKVDGKIGRASCRERV